MNTRWLTTLLTFCFLFGSLALQAEDQPKKLRVLMLTQSKGFTHDSVRRREGTLAPAEIAMTQLGQKTGLFQIHCTQDAADITKDNLKNYDIVMFYTTGDLPIAEADLNYFIKEWLTQKGHGLIGFHSATDTFHNFQPYWDLIGGTFNGHPWNADANVTITVHDPAHPAMKPFGEEFEFTDEIYQYKNWQPEKVHVLMSLNMAKSKLKKPYHVPVAWCKNVGEGKMFYTNLGHRNETWTNEKFLQSVVGAIHWINNTQPGDATPNPDLSNAQEEKSKTDAAP